ncbi:HAD hydrolase-like protein [Mesorhizobium sp. YR577]|uniref:HAD hydrolase-like protein n=1 Tax=Mesorhizobium sp. YR577 TaxID=1884373 RepID=UPI0008EA5A27|nr:HAD hydrolase-like protein [Mesorhizobium sp. YR577]SFU10707.1 HAD-hyrolase-like [Mesorhizobium sp. YR577]
MAAAILAVTRPVPHRIIGKPEPTLFKMGCNRLELEPLDVTMIGDNPETGGLGARRLSMRFIQVLDGRIGKKKPELLLATG